ncbi:MAG: hypothetical protein GXY79_03665, partial [Chloroflexi bacterium]|nr:hypothetical protein [Chloroflexota bacterium]
SMIPYHFLHEQTLAKRLDEYKAVILPDQRYLSPDLVEALPGWVERGGVLLATGLTGTLDDTYADMGQFALGDLLGLRYEGTYDQPHAYIAVTDERLQAGTLNMPHLAETTFALARPVAEDVQVLANLHKIYLRSDGRFLLRWSPVGEYSGYPAITARRVGKGWAAYIAGDPFRAYQVKNQWNLKHVVANLLGLLIEQPLVQVDAPAWVEVTLMRQEAEGRTLVHLVNQHGNRPVDRNYYCLEQPLPVRDITVRLRCASQPSRVTLEPEGIEPVWEYQEGVLTVRVPQVVIHTIIAVE